MGQNSPPNILPAWNTRDTFVKSCSCGVGKYLFNGVDNGSGVQV